MNKREYITDFTGDGIINDYEIYNGNLVLSIEVHYEGESMFLEKSIFMGSNEYNELKNELGLGDINQYHDLDQLNGMGLFVDVIRLENGIHTIGEISFNECLTDFFKTLENENEE